MDPNTCFQAVLALNNLGVSLVKGNCLEHAIQVFVDALNTLGDDMTSMPMSALFTRPCGSLVLRQKSTNASIDPGYCPIPITFVSADVLVRYVRSLFRDKFEEIQIEWKTSHMLHLISFTESLDFGEHGAWEAVVAIIFSNLGTAHFAMSAKESKVNNASWAAHYLWEYSAFLCERIVYDDRRASADWITQARCLLLLLYRCLQDTSTTLNLEDKDDNVFIESLAAESICLWENETFRKMPRSQTIADAA